MAAEENRAFQCSTKGCTRNASDNQSGAMCCCSCSKSHGSLNASDCKRQSDFEDSVASTSSGTVVNSLPESSVGAQTPGERDSLACAPVLDTAVCISPGCGKPSWNGMAGAKCGETCAPGPVGVVVAAVGIPALRLNTVDNVTFFGVDVSPEGGGVSWRVMRRYREFRELYLELRSSLPATLFPRKLLFGCSGAKLEARRSSLEMWLKQALEYSNSQGPLPKSLSVFLGIIDGMQVRSPDHFSCYFENACWKPRTGALQELLKQGCVHLLRAQYVLELQKGRQAIRRYQELPVEAFCRPPELFRDDGSLAVFLCALSHQWIEPRVHADPHGFHLAIVAKFLAKFLQLSEQYFKTRQEAALFWDYASFPQTPRTVHEENQFIEGLHYCDLLFGHEVTYVFIQPSLPNGFLGATYTESAWPLFTASVGAICKRTHQWLDISLMDPQATNWEELTQQCTAARHPPRTPALFNHELDTKLDNPEKIDVEAMKNCYQRTFHAIAAGCEDLKFHNLGWGSPMVRLLLDVFPYFTRCKMLDLTGNPLGEDGGRELLEGLTDDLTLLPYLQTLLLYATGCGAECEPMVVDLKRQRPELDRVVLSVTPWRKSHLNRDSFEASVRLSMATIGQSRPSALPRPSAMAAAGLPRPSALPRHAEMASPFED